MCRLSWNLGASTSWIPQGLSRPVMGLLYLYLGLYGTHVHVISCTLMRKVLPRNWQLLTLREDRLQRISPSSDSKCGKYRQKYINALVKNTISLRRFSGKFCGHLLYGIIPKSDEKYRKYVEKLRKMWLLLQWFMRNPQLLNDIVWRSFVTNFTEIVWKVGVENHW